MPTSTRLTDALHERRAGLPRYLARMLSLRRATFRPMTQAPILGGLKCFWGVFPARLDELGVQLDLRIVGE